MAQKNLEAKVILKGQVDKTFDQIGLALQQAGNLMDGISRSLIDFGKESLETYGDYEQNMLDAEGALRTSYQESADLERVMRRLNTAASEWASTTKFHTNDVSKAILEAANAGWDYQEMMEGIPQAILLAQAGNLSLSDSLDYLIKISNATGMSMGDLGGFVDEWSFSAKSSATTIDEMGEAMLRMGSTMRFAGTNEDLLVMLAALADMGTVGSDAGTLLRNTMIRIVAPTKTASEAMETLGVDAEELADIYGDDYEIIQDVSQQLADLGFSAYDSEGNLKNMTQIFAELYSAVNKVGTEEERNHILSKIFPTRTITGALGLLEAANNSWGGLLGNFDNAEGYAGYLAELQMSGLNGQMALFLSKWEELQRKTGETLAPDAETWMDRFGSMIDKVNGMDSESFSVLVSGLKGVAAAGPSLLIAGAAFRFMGALLTPAGGIAAAATGALVLANAMATINSIDFGNKFGQMSLDSEALASYVRGLGSEFDGAYADVSNFKAALDGAVTSYGDAAQTFSSKLTTLMLTGNTLTEEDMESLKSLGTKMYSAVDEGIANASAESMAFWQYIFGDSADIENDAYLSALGTENTEYQSLINKARSIGQSIADALTDAFSDRKLDETEVANIKAYMEDYNRVLAEAAQSAADTEAAIQLEMMMHRGQNLSWESYAGYVSDVNNAQAQRLGTLDDDYAYQRARYVVNSRNQGMSEYEIQQYLSAFDAQYGIRRAEATSGYNQAILSAFGALMSGSDLSGDYATVGKYAASVLGGNMDLASAFSGVDSMLGTRSTSQIHNAVKSTIDALGGIAEVMQRIDEYDLAGMTGDADALRNLAVMYGLTNERAMGQLNMSEGWIDTLFGTGSREANKQYADAVFSAYLQKILEQGFDISDFQGQSQDIQSRMVGLVNAYGMSAGDSSSYTEAASRWMSEAQAYIGEQPPIEATGELTGASESAGTWLSEAQAALNSSSLTARVNITGQATVPGLRPAAKYAEGGRADRASIFGEAGPEWAIPEEHSERTAMLLDAARKAAGFTWGELLARNGGLNAGGGNQIVYSPVIYANDASGVEEKLLEDKKRFARYFEDKRMRDEVEVFA